MRMSENAVDQYIPIVFELMVKWMEGDYMGRLLIYNENSGIQTIY